MNTKNSSVPEALLPLRSEAPSSERPAPRREKTRAPVDPKLEAAAAKYSLEHDATSFGTLFGAAQKPMKAVVSKLGIRTHSVDDVVNEVGIILWAERAEFDGKYWDFVDRGCGIAHYQALSAGRAAKAWQRTTRVAHGSTPLCVGIMDTDHAANPEESLMARQAVASLPAQDRQILGWRAEGRTFVQIGKELGVTRERACQIYARILKDLRGSM